MQPTTILLTEFPLRDSQIVRINLLYRSRAAQPQMLGAAYGAPTMSYDPALSTGVYSPAPATR
jgi:hypothetical protein